LKKAIASHVSLEEERYRLTLEALADVDARRTVEHAEVEAWVDGLSKREDR
jgi:predicted transcriptional regulator